MGVTVRTPLRASVRGAPLLARFLAASAPLLALLLPTRSTAQHMGNGGSWDRGKVRRVPAGGNVRALEGAAVRWMLFGAGSLLLPATASRGQQTLGLVPRFEESIAEELAAEGGLPEAAEEGISEAAEEGLPESGQEGVSESAQEGVPESAQEGVPESAQEELPESAEGVPKSPQEGVPESVQEVLGSAQEGVFGSGSRAGEAEEAEGQAEDAETGAPDAGAFLVPRHRVCLPPPRPLLRPWRPPPGKFLLAHCSFFGTSNRIFCLRRYLLLAASMKRTLILLPAHPCSRTFPGGPTDRALVDVPHLRDCLMRSAGGTSSDHPGYFPSDSSSAWGGAQGSEGAGPALGRAEGAAAARWVAHQRLAREQGTGLWAVTLREFQEMRGGSTGDQIHVDVPWSLPLLLWKPRRPQERCNGAGALSFHRRHVDLPWDPSPDPRNPQRYLLNDTWVALLAQATESLDVVSLLDVYYAHFLPFDFIDPTPMGHALRSPCSLLFLPEAHIMRAADEFWRTRLGGLPYAAVHFRLKEEFHRVARKKGWAAFSLKKAVNCVIPKILASGLRQVFVAVDMPGAMGPFAHRLSRHGIRMVLLPSSSTAEGRAPYSREESAHVEKVLCAGSSAFFQTPYSTFSYHIQWLRAGLGMASCQDEPICKGRYEDTLKMR